MCRDPIQRREKLVNGCGLRQRLLLRCRDGFPQSRHTGFAERDYTAGLTQREDGTYAF